MTKRKLIEYPAPNVNLIKVDEVFKNYKDLCERLGEITRTSNSKTAQVKNWERYFGFKKEGIKLVITEIYHAPKDPVDLREEGGNNVKYLNKIEYLILDLLAEEKNKGKVFISKNKLLEALDVVNPNYMYAKYNASKVADYTAISQYSINDFYDTTDGVLKRNLASALKSLKDKSLIFYSEVVTISVAETETHINKDNKVGATRKVEVDDNGKRKVSFSSSNVSVKENVRKATEQEVNNILRVTNVVLKEYGYKKASEAFAYGKASEFYKRINDILFNDYNIDMHYVSYEIYFNHDHILEEKKILEGWAIEESKRIASVMNLNEDIINRLKENLNRRQMDAETKFIETEKDVYKFRMTEEYAEEQCALMSIMITFGSDILQDAIKMDK